MNYAQGHGWASYQPQCQCVACGHLGTPIMTTRVSTTGWIVFGVLLLFFFPLFWVGLLMKEPAKQCPRCGSVG